MKVLGVDPSTKLCGLAISLNDQLIDIDVWVGDPKDSVDRRLYDWDRWYGDYVRKVKPDLVVYEEVSYVRNMDTIRKLARTEAVVIIQTKKLGIPVIEGKATAARQISLGKGNIKKEDVLLLLKKRYSSLPWLSSNKGGMDQADAAVMALGGPTILERS